MFSTCFYFLLVAEKQRELEEVKRKWVLETNSLNEQLEVLKKEIERKDEALIKAVNDAQSEGDQKVSSLQREHSNNLLWPNPRTMELDHMRY